MTSPYHISFSTPFGWMRPVSDGHALTRLDWDQQPWDAPDNPDNVSRETMTQLQSYFAGERRTFDLPLNPEGKSAAGRQWLEVMATIPYGSTYSYKEYAIAAGKPGAARAAGSACATNPIPIIYPCHRVVKTDGSLGNYGGGSDYDPQHPDNLERKAALLALESARR